MAGFIYNSRTETLNAIILKYNATGIFNWSHTCESNGEGKGYGIDLEYLANNELEGIYITGYQVENNQNILIRKLNVDGDSLWQSTYNSPYNFDDVEEDDADKMRSE